MNKLSAIAQAATPGGRGGTAGSAGSATREETRAFMQRRVAGLGFLITLLFGSFLLYRVVAVLVSELGGRNDPPPTALPWQALACSAFAANAWLLCRGRPRSLRFVQVTEEVGIVVGCVATMVMGFHIPYPVRPDYIVLMALAWCWSPAPSTCRAPRRTRSRSAAHRCGAPRLSTS